MLAGPDAHPTAWHDAIDITVKVVALLVGAVWTWTQYWRTHPNSQKPHVEAEGTFFEKNGDFYLAVHCTMKNVGQSEYWIEKVGTACRSWALTKEALQSEPEDEGFDAIPAFTDHTQMEAGAMIQDSLIIAIPVPIKLENIVAFRIGLRVRVSGTIPKYRKVLRKIFESILVWDLEKFFGKDFRNRFATFNDVFGEHFEKVFGKKFETAFGKDYFEEVFEWKFEDTLGRNSTFKNALLQKAWNKCRVRSTVYTTNCIVEIPKSVPRVNTDAITDWDFVHAWSTKEK